MVDDIAQAAKLYYMPCYIMLYYILYAKLYFQNCGIKTLQVKCLHASVFYMQTVLNM